jgi:adenylylsulfate kinase
MNSKKAQKGEIKNMTGLQSPYEEPINPEVMRDTEKTTPQECLDKIISYLKKSGYLKD